MSEKKVWLVDLDGTLYHAGRAKKWIALELACFGVLALPTIKAFRHAHEEIRQELAEDPSRSYAPSPFAEQLKRAAKQVKKDEDVVERVILEWMFQRPGKWLRRSLRKDLIEEIEAFRETGGKIAVVSDYPAEEKLRAMGIRSLVDLVVASGEFDGIERLKPAPDALLAALRALEVEPSEALMIGDREDADGLAAKNAGIDFRLVH